MRTYPAADLAFARVMARVAAERRRTEAVLTASPRRRRAEIQYSGGAIYYVDGVSGGDGRAGTSPGTAWATVGRVNSQTLRPGDSVLFQGGQTFSGTLLHLVSAGSAAGVITIGSYGAGRATLSNGTNNAVWLDKAGGYAFRNLNFTGISGSTAFAGVNAFASGTGPLPGISFTGCSFTGWQYGLQIGGSAATDGFRGITIDSCDASGNLYGGISIFSQAAFNPAAPVYAHTGLLITNTTANNNTGLATVTTQGTGTGINVSAVRGGTVTGCTAHSNGSANGDTSSGPVGIIVYSSDSVTITGCLSYSNASGTPTVDGDGFDIDTDSTNCIIEYCLAYSNAGAGILLYGGGSDTFWNGNTARFNLCWGNAGVNTSYGDLTLGGNLSGAQVYGNTCVSHDGASTFPSPLLVQAGTFSGCALRNNILYAGGFGNVIFNSSTFTTAQLLLQGNDYWSAHTWTVHWNGTDYATLAAWRTATNQEIRSGPVNTGLSSDSQLAAPTVAPSSATTAANMVAGAAGLIPGAGSPVTQAGLDLAGLFGIAAGGRDFYGNVLAAPLWVGAYSH